jgi:hypothetical protein
MAVHVDLCPRGPWCFDNRCSLPARLTVQSPGNSSRDYCLDDAMSRLGVHTTCGEQITYSDSARYWVEAQGRRVVV